MKNKFLVIVILFSYISIAFAQDNLNAYKYVIVPEKYDFLKEDDKYQLNSLTKFLFDKDSFQTMFENESYPADLLANPCLAVTVGVNDNSTMFTSKLVIELKNCYNKVVFTSAQGKSKEKDYKRSYQEALRNAFISINELDYNYDSKLVNNVQVSAHTPNPKSTPIVTVKAIDNIEDKQVTNVTPENQVVTQTLIPKAVPVKPLKTADNAVENQTVNVVPVKKTLANSYKSDKISFLLIKQNNSLVAYISDSKDDTYQKGEMIGTLLKTSLPDIYRVTWKNKEGKFEETTGYFDKAGDLNIDVNRDGKIEVVIFKVEK